jgi:hypothetical protein
MRQTYVFRDGKAVPKHLARPLDSKRSHLSAPMLIRDTMDPIQGQMDGKLYDSKSAYNRAVRDAGCVVVGNEKMEGAPPNFDPSPAEADVKQAMDQLGIT